MPAKKQPVEAPIMSAIEDLIAAQNKCVPLIKNQKAHHYKYADLNAVFESCKHAFTLHNFALYHISGQDEYGMFVKTVLHHKLGTKYETTVYLVMGKNDMQALGSALTYARRYGVLMLAGLAAEDDDGEATKGFGMPSNSQPNTSKTPPQPRAVGASPF